MYEEGSVWLKPITLCEDNDRTEVKGGQMEGTPSLLKG